MNTTEASIRRFARFAVMGMMLASAPAGQADPNSPLCCTFAPDGGHLVVGDATSFSVKFIHLESREITATVPLSGRPEGFAWSADGARLFASESGAGSIAEIDASGRKVIRRFATGRYPSGLAMASGRRLLLVCDRGLDRLSVLDSASGKTIAHIPVGRQPMNVAVSADETIAVVANLIPSTAATAPDHAADVTILDLTTMAARSSVRLPTGSTNLRGIAIDTEGRKAYVVHTIGRFHLPTTQLDRGWVNTNALSVIDLPSATRVATFLLDQVMDGAADPWGVALNPEGDRLFITLSGTHQLAVIDVKRLSAMTGTDPDAFTNDLSALHRESVLRRVDLPARGPRGMAVSGDGRMLAVTGYFSGNIILLDPEAMHPVSFPIGPQSEPDLARRGEASFNDASRCFQRWLSCASCHPDARSDGLNWDLLNDGIGNPKNARSMLLSHRTPPMMSLGIRDRMETAVRAGFVHIQFTQPGIDEVEAVGAYLRSLQPETSPYRMPDGSLSEAAVRGERIFRRSSVGCARCHSAPLYTNLKLKDVGTASAQDRGQTRYDVPTLIELWRTPPYLHDGRAATLREVLVNHNTDDEHGETSSLQPAEIDDLIEYILSL